MITVAGRIGQRRASLAVPSSEPGPIAGAARPERSGLKVRSQLIIPNFSTWNVHAVRDALERHELGDFRLSAMLADAMGRSPRIAAALATRVLACAGLPFSFDPNTGDGRRNEAAVKRVLRYWPRMAPVETLVELWRWYLYMGFALAQLKWSYDAISRDWVPSLEVWHPSMVRYIRGINQWFVLTTDGQIPIEPGDGQWLLLTASSMRPWLRGAVRVLALPDLVRSFAVRDWARYSEVHGLPVRVAKIPAGADNDVKEEFVDAIDHLGSETTILAEQYGADRGSFGLELAEARSQEHEAFQRLMASCDADVTIALLGTNLTTERTPGVYVPGSNGDGVRRDYMESDVAAMASALQEQLLRPWARFNLGEDATGSAPIPRWETRPQADLTAEATGYRDLGDALKIGRAHV